MQCVLCNIGISLSLLLSVCVCVCVVCVYRHSVYYYVCVRHYKYMHTMYTIQISHT